MSSLRVESVRLCWLEAFLAVAKEENMSAAARDLCISQPTVSRYVTYLEQWTGRKLVLVGHVRDPENARVKVGLTEDGRKLFDIAEQTVNLLGDFRSEDAKSEEALASMRTMIKKMQDDLTSDTPTNVALSLRDNIETFNGLCDPLDATTTPETLKTFDAAIRKIFSECERLHAKELRARRERARRTIKAANLTVPTSRS